MAGVGEALLIAALAGAATYGVNEATKPKMPGMPDIGADPTKVGDNPENALAAARARRAQQVTRDQLRIDPGGGFTTGIQIPGP